jgi:hypothetical protein
MWKILNGHTNQALETTEFCLCLQELNETKYKSAIWQSKIAMLSTAGITTLDSELLNWIGYFRQGESSHFIYNADIFKVESGLLYIINARRENRIEAGIITKDTQVGLKELGRFCNAFSAALKKKLDGRKVRHMKIGWYQFSQNDKIEAQVSHYKRFTFPLMIEEEIQMSHILEDERLRSNLTLISKSGMIKESELQIRYKDIPLRNLNELLHNSLITENYVISCRKNNAQLGIMQSVDELKNFKILKCPICGKSFTEELITKQYSISDKGKKMITGSHWMTVWITKILLKHGIDEKSIIWNLNDASEEIDCAVQVNGRLWIFELKDRNFESGDAQRLGHRAIKFKAHKAIVVTTGIISGEARSVLRDLSEEKLLYNRGWSPFYIEGIDETESSIEKLVSNEIVFNVQEKCKLISKSSSVDLGPVFHSLFGQYSYTHKGKFVDD